MSQFFEITPEMQVDSPVEKVNKMIFEQIKKRDDACYEEMAQVVRKHFPDTVCTGYILRDRLTKLVEAERRLKESDCPSCGQYPRCHHNQGAHGVVRINCPLWRPKG